MAAKRKTKLTWSRRAASTEGSPIVVADLETFTARAGDVEGASEDVDIDGGAVLLDTNGGGGADVGLGEDSLVVLLTSGEFDDDPKRLAKLVTAIESSKFPEFLVGTIEPKGDLVVDDSASTKPAFTVPWRPGRYTVVEGRFEGDDGEEARWCRIVPEGLRTYAKRPASAPIDPVDEVLSRISFAGPKEEARALEAALELVELGRPELALEVCAKASASRRALAAWTRVLALAARNDPAVVGEATSLAEEWLRPADSTEHPNQVLPRAHVLSALDASGAGAALRARVVAAPEPEVFVVESGDDFF